MTPQGEFIHRFEPGADAAGPVLLLLHGTGGNEDDLISLGPQLLPGAALLSPRGRVLENGMPRFFRRLAEGVFDIPDLKLQTEELAKFISLSRVRYGLISNSIIAAGYSNGANIAGALLLMHPEVLSGAVLFRPMVPFRPRNRPKLDGVRIFLSAGRRDPIVPAENTLELARLFEEANADVLLHWYNGGHQLSPEDVGAAAHWLASAYNQRR